MAQKQDKNQQAAQTTGWKDEQQKTASMNQLRKKFLDDVESGRRATDQAARTRQAENVTREDRNTVPRVRMQDAEYMRYKMLRAALQRSGLSEEEQKRELALAGLGNLVVL